MWHTDASEQDRSSSKGTKGTTNICAGPFPCPLACCIGLGWTGKLKLLTTTALLSMVSGFVDFSPILSDGLRAFSGRQAPHNPLKICFMKTWQNQNSYNHQHPSSSSCPRVLPHERIRNRSVACMHTYARPSVSNFAPSRCSSGPCMYLLSYFHLQSTGISKGPGLHSDFSDSSWQTFAQLLRPSLSWDFCLRWGVNRTSRQPTVRRKKNIILCFK